MKSRLEAQGDFETMCHTPYPAIPDDLGWIWRAYNRLTASRTWLGGGMGLAMPAPIQFESVIKWAEYHDYDVEMTRMLEQCIQAMDAVYCKYMQEQAAVKK